MGFGHSPTVAVIGAGIAGAQAALDLARMGCHVVLVERGERPGGRLLDLIKTFPTNDCSACHLSPEQGFFCLRSPYFINLLEPGKVEVLSGVEVKDITGKEGRFTLRLYHKEREENREVDALILCPGYEEYIPSILERRYGYGHYPGVWTGLQLEKHLASGKALRRPSDGGMVERVAFIQCAGSRDPVHGVPYCSTICCLYALKEALLIAEAARLQDLPLPEITLFYMDIRTYGKTYERYLEKARESIRLRLIRSRVHSLIQPPGHPRLLLRYALDDGTARVEEFDLVILSTGVKAPVHGEKIAKKLQINLNSYGFAAISPFSPVSNGQPGVFVAGAFTGPCDVIDAVTQGSAAAAACLLRLRELGHTLDFSSSSSLSQSSPSNSGSSFGIGVIICDCPLLKGNLNLKELEKYALTLTGVTAVKWVISCPLKDTREIERLIKDQALGHVVIAACSARALEPVMVRCLKEIGLPLNRGRVVNLLAHATRLYSDSPRATNKAKELIRIAVNRVQSSPPLKVMGEGAILNSAALVVGGGVAGMVSALTLARLGYEVHLVEKEKRLGGNARCLYQVLEGGQVESWLSTLEEQVSTHPQVHLYLGARVIKSEGQVGCFKSTVEIDEERKREIIEHGALIIATGAKEKEPNQYLYGQHPRVVTGLKLEERLKFKREELARLNSVVFIQCVHSRDKDHPYCSRTCCSETLKNALELKKINPGLKIYILNRDIMAYGFKEQWYEAARSQGILFVRYTPEAPPEVEPAGGDRLKVKVYEPILGEEVFLLADLVVLATGVEPPQDNMELAQIFKLPLDEYGFFTTLHPKLKTVETPVPGVLTCGLAEGPKSLEETIVSAQAAALKAALVLKGEKNLPWRRVARVEGACAACLTCVRVCPHGAPSIIGNRSSINPLLCQGCGNCVAHCPAGAITLVGYSKEEIEAELRALKTCTDGTPTTVVYTCSYCAYAYWENLGSLGLKENVSVLQVPCLSRIGTWELLKALEMGAKEVILTGCTEDQCHFRPPRVWGSRSLKPDPATCQEKALKRVRDILRWLGEEGEVIKVWRLPPPHQESRGIAGFLRAK
ncbi:heterodisulfide reductase subunit A [Thermanaeromonas toyohensis ToBE]|uniref:Heterodisulfide reductase subunit A n=1 Tax=Thermanaeromonas toyohensis ToBE TaxID=698762 RepID=A0A1W1W2A0_9FIRM|nr:FAD-dependent oxidoreductase [Thermanaeromonas toyohensis]SMB99716.1 heterodisulfide reductase subunit A [Thermanaeromonas toyohensis ToBE]